MKFYAPIKLSENMRRTPEGFLLCLGVAIARTGEMIYGPGETPIEVGPGGKVIISRDEKEVFSEATIASFSGKPVTIRHPEADVTPENWAVLAKGSIQNPRRGSGEQDQDLIADVLIMDQDAILMVEERGLREVSCGYDAEYVQVEPGRGYQEKIVGNHLALVENGRAGTAYAIRDHQRKEADDMKTRDENAPKKKDKKGLIAKIFSRAQDEATKVLDEESVEESIVGDAEVKKDDQKPTYDELSKMCDALKSEVAELKKGKDELKKSPDGAEVEDEEAEAKDEDPMVSIMARLDALEAKIEKVVKAESAEAAEMTSGDEGESTEEVVEEKVDDAEAEVEVEDSAHMTGDTASRAEILAPGIKLTKDVKVQALKQAYTTKDGQAAIHRFTGGKAPNFAKPETVEMIFVGASELLKASRSDGFASTKKTGARDTAGSSKLPLTPEAMNAKNAAFYNKK